MVHGRQHDDALVAGGRKEELNAMGVPDEVIYWGCNSGTCATGVTVNYSCSGASIPATTIFTTVTLLRTLLSYELPLTIV